MTGDRGPFGPTLIYTLAELIADPECGTNSIEPIIPFLAWKERVSLFAAREKDGKSTFAGAAAAAVSAGREFLGCQVTQRPVLWVGLEEHKSDIVRRFQSFDANRYWVFVMTSSTRPLDDLEIAVSQILETGHPAPLVVIDTLSALAGGEVEDAGSSTQWTPLMQRLNRVAREDGAAVLILHHARKSDGDYRDSTAIGANVDMILRISAANGNRRTITGKGRWPHTEFIAELASGSFHLVAGGKPLDEWVLDFVQKNSGCSMRQVREGVVGANPDIDATVRALLDDGRLVNGGSSTAFALRLASPSARAGDPNP